MEPPPSPWVFPDLADPAVAARFPYDDIAEGADLTPGTLLAAYRSGLFPMPGPGRRLDWFSPDPRGVLVLPELRVSRSLRRSVREFEIRVDTAFTEVVRACGSTRRDGNWITADFVEAYAELHRLGWAHSVETWRDGRLVGGLYGVEIGGLFAGESMFHTVTDASKVALVALVERLRAAPGPRLLDVQWETDHLATLGVRSIPRMDYLQRLAEVRDTRPCFG